MKTKKKFMDIIKKFFRFGSEFEFGKLLRITFYLTAVAILISCNCGPTMEPTMEEEKNININSNFVLEFSENIITNAVPVNIGLTNFYSISAGYDTNDVFITNQEGVDVSQVINNLNVDLSTMTVSGSLDLYQRLDFEAPIDENTNNDYEIITFILSNVDNFSTNFKIIVRITNMEPEQTGPVIERSLSIVSYPENTKILNVPINEDILELYIGGNYDPANFSVSHIEGNDIAILDPGFLVVDTNDKTISGFINLSNRLNYEMPISDDGGNDYEVAVFRIVGENVSNDFKLLVRVTNLVKEPRQLEILVDSFLLEDVDRKRGIRELYLYEDSQMMDPLMGDDSNNFLRSELIASSNVIGSLDASANVSNLYDGDDSTSGFLTATTVNSSSNTYHRISLEFTENVNIQKVAIRGRQLGGYYGFVFILRDTNGYILSSHRALNENARGGTGIDSSVSTFSYIPNYANFVTITNFDIRVLNANFLASGSGVGEGEIVVDNFSVSSGYEYERGFVNFAPGVDAGFFNTNSLYISEGELRGLSFVNTSVLGEDDDGDNIYEVGSLTATNIDGGSTTMAFTLQVGTGNWLQITNQSPWSARANFQAVVLNNGDILVMGGDEGGFYPRNDIWVSEDQGRNWRLITDNAPWRDRANFQAVVLNNGDVLVMGGRPILNDIWRSGDGGVTWSQVPYTGARWSPRQAFQAVVLSDDRIVVTGGWGIDSDEGHDYLRDVWSSSDGGSNWSLMTSGAPWDGRAGHRSLVTSPSDRIWIMGGEIKHSSGYQSTSGAVWYSDNNGAGWAVLDSGMPGGRIAHQLVLLSDNTALVLGGESVERRTAFSHTITNERGDNTDIYAPYILNTRYNKVFSRFNGTWSTLSFDLSWGVRSGHQAVVLEGDVVLVLGGSTGSLGGAAIVGGVAQGAVVGDIWQFQF